MQSDIFVRCLKHKSKNSSLHVLKRLREFLKKEDLGKFDEAWVVVDKDMWPDEQLAQLHEWSQEAENYGFALSNPKFEYWILLHFEKGMNIVTSQECSDRLKQYMPEYNTGI